MLLRDRELAPSLPENTWPIARRDWELAVGSKIAARTRPQKLERGVLWVVTATASWSNELSLLAQPIVERLRKSGVDVRELRFRVGKLEEPIGKPRRPAKLLPRPVAIEGDLRASLRAVEDPELRTAIERAARISLAFRAGK